MKQICFISRNEHKRREIQELFSSVAIKIIPIDYTIEEIQTDDVEKLLRDKLIKAFKYVGRPVFVEHTGLYINKLKGLPGGLTQVFWDRLQAETFSELLCEEIEESVEAKTAIGYCDGAKVHFFHGSIMGKLAPTPRGDRSFQWDCIFIPQGHDQTFAELGSIKNEISMRKKAFEAFKSHLIGGA